MESSELLRAPLFHTPRNPFQHADGLKWEADGGLLLRGGRVAACGDYGSLCSTYPEAAISDLRGGFLLPGLIDTHTHFPQLRIMGSLGYSLLDWLEQRALPEEARMADAVYARETAGGFVRALLSHGTTTASVFGAHFPAATAALFEAAEAGGMRVVSGLVLSDRRLRPELHQTPEAAYHASTALLRCFHGRGRLLYSVTPRFALSTSAAMLEVCQTLLREHAGLRLQTHLNESRQEIAEVGRLFPRAATYLAVYDQFGLVRPGSVFAHDVHPQAAELERLAASGAAVAHCPASNAALGSGIFPMRRHLEAGVPCALGTDIGAGTGFSLLREALQAYLMQQIAPEGLSLNAAHLLYLTTRAGAEALGLEAETGDFQKGKAADLLYLRPQPGSPLAAAVQQATGPQTLLGALITLAGPESVCEVRVAGEVVYRRDAELS
jgi:guanine deaminase